MKARLPRSSGCWIDTTPQGKLRLRWRAADGKKVGSATHLDPTAANRTRLEPLRALVAQYAKKGEDPRPLLEKYLEPCSTADPTAPPPTLEHTLRSYADEVFLTYQTPLVRKAQARDYRRHLKIVCQRLGDTPLSLLRPTDVRALQTELLEGRSLSIKYAKNIISGSLHAMTQQALDDKVIAADPFPRRLKWPKWKPPGADPFTPEERTRIIEWFDCKLFGVRPGPGSTRTRRVPHPPYPALVRTLFWTGLRPSEAAGLQWQDIDLAGGRLHVQRSRHLYDYAAPKTESADRWVELFPSVVAVLRDLQPVRVEPETPVFTTTEGNPIEPKAFASRYWYRCLRALGIRVRGIYCTKDTFVTTALRSGVKIAWLEAQTGVSYATLKRHYGRWMPREDQSELRRFADEDPTLFGRVLPHPGARPPHGKRQRARKPGENACEEGDLNPHGCLAH